MKDLVELTSKSSDSLPTIYCDLDQVLVNFMKGADEALGGNFATSSKEERWKIINNTKGFWAGLEWMPGAKRLYQFIAKYDPHVLSAYTGRDPSSKNGKMKWLAKNAKFTRANIHLVLRNQKKEYAKSGETSNVLIDDYKKNTTEWEAAGGIAIHHTNVGKTLSELKRLGFK